jgi:hypothetical protein
VSDPDKGGHVFVVHGRIESLVHDAAVVPVASGLKYASVWRPLVGQQPVRPDDWSNRGWGRIHNAPDRVWAVSVGVRTPGGYDIILDRIRSVVARVDERRGRYPLKRPGHTLPLLAVPVVGIGRGGFADDMGSVLGQLVKALHQWVREYNVDIALVTPDSAVYAAAQYARRHHSHPLPGELERVAVGLADRARKGHLALFLGAGVSRAAGLPTWHELINQLAHEFDVEGLDAPGVDLSPTDQAEMIQKKAKGHFEDSVASIASSRTQPSLLHALLAGLDCHQVVTTNYDLLYETAVRATGRDIAGVMPWTSVQDAERWILKLHGDVEHRDKIVLTRRHMVRYDAANRPS